MIALNVIDKLIMLSGYLIFGMGNSGIAFRKTTRKTAG